MTEQAVHQNYIAAREAGRFQAVFLETGFDVEEIRVAYQRLVGEHAIEAASRAEGSTLRSISLTHRPDAKDPLYDGNNTQFNPETNEKLFRESDFSVFNESFKNTIFYRIYRQMPFRIGRMRIMLLNPLSIYAVHRDSAPRAHIAITTNPACFLMTGGGETSHVPADGNVYIFDTTLPHTAFNASLESRVHLTMALADEEQ